MKTFHAFLLLSGTLGLIGCALTREPPVAAPTQKSGQSTPLANAQNATDAANAAAAAKRADLDAALMVFNSKLAANLDTALDGNAYNVDGPGKMIVQGELSIARSRLHDTQADMIERGEGIARRDQVLAGDATGATKAYDAATLAAKKSLDELVSLRVAKEVAEAEAARLREAEKTALKDFETKLEANRIANQAAISKLEAAHKEELDKERKTFNRRLGYFLMGIGGVLLLGGAFSAYAGVSSGDPFKGVLRGLVLAGAGAFCFVIAWTINQVWFKWVVIGGGVLSVVAGVLFLWTEWREAQEKKDLLRRSREADEAESTLKVVNKVLDPIPREDPIKVQLSSLMDKPQKALVNELKAEQQRSEAPPATTH